MNGEEAQTAAVTSGDSVTSEEIDNEDMDVSYIDRIVCEVENNGKDDDSSLDLMEDDSAGSEEDSNEVTDREEHEGGSVANEEEEKEESAEENNSFGEKSDVELEFDSDDDPDDDSNDDSDDDSDEKDDDDVIIRRKLKKHCYFIHAPSKESKAQLLWRLDKGDSFSDWSLEVKVRKRDGCSKTTYHVHRSMLAAGQRKSGYFEALFKPNQFK
mmetsp:Transcript_30657/g.45089  ORF Transcript_30657/g.45089 Transcript_30657/m.45089 type:complete len:213 (-) Transcript_30657:1058-1696(-)